MKNEINEENRRKRLEAELRKMGINSPGELKEAMRATPPLDVSIMTAPARADKERSKRIYGFTG